MRNIISYLKTAYTFLKNEYAWVTDANAIILLLVVIYITAFCSIYLTWRSSTNMPMTFTIFSHFIFLHLFLSLVYRVITRSFVKMARESDELNKDDWLLYVSDTLFYLYCWSNLLTVTCWLLYLYATLYLWVIEWGAKNKLVEPLVRFLLHCIFLVLLTHPAWLHLLFE